MKQPSTSKSRWLACAVLVFAPFASPAQDNGWQTLFNGKNLDGWEVRGEGIWTVLPGGILLGQRKHADVSNPFPAWPVDRRQYQSWLYRQAWLYTVRDFGEFDLHVEYLIPPGMNSGVSIRDVSRAHFAIGEPEGAGPRLTTTLKGTPAHVGYEIQIIDSQAKEKYPSGSIYLFAAARTGVQKDADWNSLDIESRNDAIRVKVNGVTVAENAGDPARSKVGPIGLQLHDQFTFAAFRSIRIREIGGKALQANPPQP